MASLKFIHEFLLLKPCIKQPGLGETVVPFIEKAKWLIWENSDEFCSTIFFQFPVIIDDNNKPWGEGCCYLLSYLKGISEPNRSTLKSIAYDLLRFKNWCEIENVDYKKSEEYKSASPTAKFTRHLIDKIRRGDLARSTALRTLGSLQNFYRWLASKHIIASAEDFWTGSSRILHVTTSNGLTFSKPSYETDLTRAVKKTGAVNPDDNVIIDGAKLKPMTKAEQKIFISVLQNLNHVEIKLAIQIALNTGSRLSTVFTLRQSNFDKLEKDSKHYLRIKIGQSTLVKNKKDKQQVIFLPLAIYESIHTYLKSERYRKRLKSSSHKYHDPSDQYLFLTQQGKAYYLHDQDSNIASYPTERSGGYIGQYFRTVISPILKQEGLNRTVTFHDLRATFGVNLVDWLSKDASHDEYSAYSESAFFQIMMFVKQRFGHADLSTTYGYFGYGQAQDILDEGQRYYEDFLMGSAES